MRKANLLVFMLTTVMTTHSVQSQEADSATPQTPPDLEPLTSQEGQPVFNEYTGVSSTLSGSCTPVFGEGCSSCDSDRSMVGWWSRCKCRQQRKWWGYPGEFNELPHGFASGSILRAQIARGQAARLTLYDYDFVRGTGSLNARGRLRLGELAALLQSSGGVIVIQSVKPDLDSLRQNEVQNAGASLHGLQPHQIVVGIPISAGLNGAEAIINRQNQLQHSSQFGVRQFNFGSFSPGSGSAAQ